MAGIELRFEPMRVPNYVLLEVLKNVNFTGEDTPKMALKDIDSASLGELCDQFRKEVFKKAKRPDLGVKHCAKCGKFLHK